MRTKRDRRLGAAFDRRFGGDVRGEGPIPDPIPDPWPGPQPDPNPMPDPTPATSRS